MSRNTHESSNNVSHPAVEITHQWSIENYPYLRYLEKKRSNAPPDERSIVPTFLQSDSFSPFEVEANCQFFLRLHPNVLQSDGKHLALYLHYDSKEMYSELQVTCTFAILNIEYKECNVKGTWVTTAFFLI